MDKIIREWMKARAQGVQLEGNKKLKTMLFADDRVVLAENEDDLQRKAKENNERHWHEYVHRAFRGKEPVRNKIVINAEQIKCFKYLGVYVIWGRGRRPE